MTEHDPSRKSAPPPFSPFEPRGYRDDAETLAARRRELEAELRALSEREASARSPSPPRWSPRPRHVLFGAATGALVAVSSAIAGMAYARADRVELDPHAELAYRRLVDEALRDAREAEAAEARRDADVRAEERRRSAYERARERDRIAGAFEAGSTICAGLTPTVVEDPGGTAVELSRVRAADPAAVGAFGRWIPHEVHGTRVGMRLYGARPGSLVRAMGFQNGDVVLELDGAPALDDVAHALHGRLVDFGIARVAVVRRGEPFDLTIRAR